MGNFVNAFFARQNPVAGPSGNYVIEAGDNYTIEDGGGVLVLDDG